MCVAVLPVFYGFDVIYGTPEREQHGILRDVASRITKLALQSAMGAETARKVSAFRAFRARLCAAFQDYRSPTVNIDVLLTWGTTRFTAVAVRHDSVMPVSPVILYANLSLMP